MVDEEQSSPFEGLFGDSAELRVAQNLLALRSQALNQKEIADISGITRQSAAKALEGFEKWKVVEVRKHGNHKLYSLKESSPVAYALDILNGALLEEITGQELIERFPRIEVSDQSTDFKPVEPQRKQGTAAAVAA